MAAIAGGTKIEWADFTFNPWWGCERVSPACAHCYADTFARRLGMSDLWPRRDGKTESFNHGFRFFGDKHWADPLKWAKTAPATLGRRPRVFCASMADVFEPREELQPARKRLYRLIEATPELDWLLLTKRPEIALVEVVFEWDEAPPNVWMGVSIENSRYTWRANVLRQIPAAVRFISAEPLLGSLFSVDKLSTRSGCVSLNQADPGANLSTKSRRPLDLTGIDWVIVGGESGPKSRPFHLDHAREIVERCVEYRCPSCRASFSLPIGTSCPDHAPRRGPAIFMKQLGAQPIWNSPNDGAEYKLRLTDKKGGDPEEWPADLRVREHPRSAA